MGGGLIEGYDDHCIQIKGREFSRTQTMFIHTPPPETDIHFTS